SDLLTAQIVEEQYVELIEKIGGIDVDIRIPYSSLGEANWVPIAQQLKSRDIRALAFVGVPEVLPQLTKAMDELNYRPDIIMADAGFYADVLIERGGSSVEGVYVRTAYSLVEEADRVPAVRDYLDMIDRYRPGGKVSGLGMQGLSAMFLFATSAKPCVENGELSRACVIEQASTVRAWTGGGLHAPADPGTNTPSPCYQMIVVKDGAFTRSYPPVPPSDEDRALVPTVEITDDGWACDDSTLLRLDGDYGDTTLGRRP
ncbi:MAG: ABC transporter substrate-binding protein, partial [Ilumatobacteraceae bacterium]